MNRLLSIVSLLMVTAALSSSHTTVRRQESEDAGCCGAIAGAAIVIGTYATGFFAYRYHNIFAQANNVIPNFTRPDSEWFFDTAARIKTLTNNAALLHEVTDTQNCLCCCLGISGVAALACCCDCIDHHRKKKPKEPTMQK